jgi:hypothetical protein
MALAALPNCRRIPGNLLQNFSQFGKTLNFHSNRMTGNSAQSMTKAWSVTGNSPMERCQGGQIFVQLPVK